MLFIHMSSQINFRRQYFSTLCAIKLGRHSMSCIHVCFQIICRRELISTRFTFIPKSCILKTFQLHSIFPIILKKTSILLISFSILTFLSNNSKDSLYYYYYFLYYHLNFFSLCGRNFQYFHNFLSGNHSVFLELLLDYSYFHLHSYTYFLYADGKTCTF